MNVLTLTELLRMTRAELLDLLPALIDLVLRRPLVSAEVVKQELGVTDTGFRKMRAALGTSLKELSGRRRYRVWGVL